MLCTVCRVRWDVLRDVLCIVLCAALLLHVCCMCDVCRTACCVRSLTDSGIYYHYNRPLPQTHSLTVNYTLAHKSGSDTWHAQVLARQSAGTLVTDFHFRNKVNRRSVATVCGRSSITFEPADCALCRYSSLQHRWGWRNGLL